MSDPRTQGRLHPVIRVFVSSTFSDMKHERNALAADAFPKLEQLCHRHGFQFQAIDLRWGVSTEAGLDHRAMRICFDELRRAQEISPRPNFLILLGNRYGWRPLPEELSVEEFDTLQHAATQIPSSAEKSAVEVLREWYRVDSNAVPPVYLLQPRRRDLGDDQDYTHDAIWKPVQAVLWTIISRAMPPTQLQRRFDGGESDGSLPAIVRFQASATEQEIWHGALRVPDAKEHVVAFFREIENFAAFSDPKQISDFVDVDSSGAVEVALWAEQVRLKAKLRQRLGSANVFRNEAPCRLVKAHDQHCGRTADVTTDHLAQFCAKVASRLSEIIQGQIQEYWRKTAQVSTDRAARELEIEQREYERFAKERGGEESFVGRQIELQAILDYVGSDSRWPLVIHGASGCGKTALLARASQELAKTRTRIERFIGVVPRSSDLRSLLSSLCQELRQRSPRPDALPTQVKELSDEFSHQLQAATPEQPLILFLDALDHLANADNGRLLNWLPRGSLPAHVKLVVSCLSDRTAGDPAGQPFAELKRREFPSENYINLDVLSEAEAHLLLFDRWLPKAGRKVSDDQRARIEQRLASPACRQPIYLKFLFEEVQLWRSYDKVRSVAGNVPKMLARFFVRLRRRENHGKLLVNRVLSYLSTSRHGLAENEILEILFADPEYRAKLDEASEQTRHELPPNAKRVPIALWSRLRFDLAPYLTTRAAVGTNVLTFYHRQLEEWVQEHFATSPDQGRQSHLRLAGYFLGVADSEANGRWTGSRRGLSELPYHLTCAREWDQLIGDVTDPGVLTNLRFIQAKCEVGLLNDLVVDYRDAQKTISTDHRPGNREFLQNFFEFVARERSVLADYPHLIWQQAMNSKASEQVARQASDRWKRGVDIRPWLRCKTSAESVSRVSYKAFHAGIQCAARSPAGDLIVAGHANGSISLHDIDAAIELVSIPVCRAGITAISFPTTESTFVVASSDGYIHCIDTENAIILHSIHAHDDTITALIPGKRPEELLTVCADGTARFWPAGAWKQEHSQPVVTCRTSLLCGAFIKDTDAVALGCSDGRLILIHYGDCWQQLEQNWDCFAPITSCATSRGGILYYASQEDVLKCARVSPSGSEHLWQARLTGTVTAIAPGKTWKQPLLGWSSGDVSVPSEKGFEVLHLHGNNVRFLSLHRNESTIISVHETGEIAVYDVPHNATAYLPRIEPPSIDKIYCLEQSRVALCLTFPTMKSGINVRPFPPLLISTYDLQKHAFTYQQAILDTANVEQTCISERRGVMFVPRIHSVGEDEQYGVSVFSLRRLEPVTELKTEAQVESIMITSDHEYIGIVDRSSHLSVWDLAGFRCLLQCNIVSYDQHMNCRTLVVDSANNTCRLERDGFVLEIPIAAPEMKTGNQAPLPRQHWRVQHGKRVIFFPFLDKSAGRLVHSFTNRVVWLQEVSKDCLLILEEDGVLSRFTSNGVHSTLLSGLQLSPRPVVLGDDVFGISRSGWLHGCHVGQAYPNCLLPIAERAAALAPREHSREILLGTVSGKLIVIEPMNKGAL